MDELAAQLEKAQADSAEAKHFHELYAEMRVKLQERDRDALCDYGLRSVSATPTNTSALPPTDDLQTIWNQWKDTATVELQQLAADGHLLEAVLGHAHWVVQEARRLEIELRSVSMEKTDYEEQVVVLGGQLEQQQQQYSLLESKYLQLQHDLSDLRDALAAAKTHSSTSTEPDPEVLEETQVVESKRAVVELFATDGSTAAANAMEITQLQSELRGAQGAVREVQDQLQTSQAQLQAAFAENRGLKAQVDGLSASKAGVESDHQTALQQVQLLQQQYQGMSEQYQEELVGLRQQLADSKQLHGDLVESEREQARRAVVATTSLAALQQELRDLSSQAAHDKSGYEADKKSLEAVIADLRGSAGKSEADTVAALLASNQVLRSSSV